MWYSTVQQFIFNLLYFIQATSVRDRFCRPQIKNHKRTPEGISREKTQFFFQY